MRIEEIFPGTRVRIRSWEDMDKASKCIPNHMYDPDRLFAGVRGVNSYAFVKRMRPLCGMDFTVRYAVERILYLDPDPITEDAENPWMIEPAPEEVEIEPDESGLFSLFA